MAAYLKGQETETETDNRRHLKLVRDNVHDDIHLDSLAMKFVDTREFQRLRDLKQLGLTYMVYPGAVHTRFEHSLGVYWLASETVNKLKCYQGLLGINQFDVQTVKLAGKLMHVAALHDNSDTFLSDNVTGLLHDVGHGPFSHAFENSFLPRFCGDVKWSHEEMSLKMIDYIVDKNNIEIEPDMIKKVKELVVATENATSRSSTDKRFLYDIVANGRNGIDVDKFDYIVRDSRACGLDCNFEFKRLFETMKVIDDEICYRAKEYLTIQKLFSSRADLHRTVYLHPKVKAIELMIVDAMINANDFLKISFRSSEPEEFWKLDDTIMKTIEVSSERELKDSRDLIFRIRNRDLYQFCNEFAVPKENIPYFQNVTPQAIICSQDSGDVTLKEEDIAVTNVKIDLTRGKDNPLEIVNFFEDYDSTEKIKIHDHRVSHMLPGAYQDVIVRVYSKKAELVGAVSKAFENYQKKMYGELTQIHGTPRKKQHKKHNR